MSNKGKIPAALENQTNIIIDEEPLSSPGLTNEQLEKARYTLDAVSTFDGTLPECREKLMSMSVHPVLEGKIPEPSQELVVESKNIGDELQENTRVEFELTAGELYGEDVDWNADQDEFEDINEVPIDHPSQTTCSVGATVQPGPFSSPNQADWEQFILQSFSTLYSNLKQGIDATLASNLELKTTFHELMAEVKMVRDEQIKLGARLTEITTKMDGLQTLTQECQFDLQEVRQEVSICTAGFSKINSALLQMNTSNIPQGALPSISNYKFEVNPTVASAKEGSRTTPLAYTREKIIDLMGKTSMPADKIPIMATMLENRTPRSFAMLLPQLNQYACVSDDASRRLIDMVDIKNGSEMKQAFVYLRALYTKPPPAESEGSALPDNQPQLTEQKNQQMSQGNNPSARTKIKRCANPFASLK